MLLKTKNFIDQKTETCIEQIKLEKEQKLNEITLVFDELIKSVFQKNVQAKADTDKSSTEINVNIEKTRDLERNRNSTLPITLLLAMKDIPRLPRRHTGNYYVNVKTVEIYKVSVGNWNKGNYGSIGTRTCRKATPM